MLSGYLASGPAFFSRIRKRIHTSRSPFSWLASSGLLQQGPDRAAAALHDALVPHMHTSAGPHTCGTATKFLRAACARSWGALRSNSGRFPRPAPLHVPPPRPGQGAELRGVSERGRSSPRRPHPHCLFLLLGRCRRRLLTRRSQLARSPSSLLAAPPPEPRLLRRPQPLSPQTFRQDGGPGAGLPRPHVIAFPALSANGK